METAVKQISLAGSDARLAAHSIRSRMSACNCEIWVLMNWTYTGNDTLARAATRLYEQRAKPCRVSPYVFMSDPERTPDILAVARKLPEGSALIYRHFGAKNRKKIAKKLRRISFERQIQLLIGQDVDLAMRVGADGVHFPERDLAQGLALHKEYPEVLVTGAAHSQEAAQRCADNDMDVAIISPVFKSNCHSAGMPIGVKALAQMVRNAEIPIFALGGINLRNVTALYSSGISGIAGVSAFGDCEHV